MVSKRCAFTTFTHKRCLSYEIPSDSCIVTVTFRYIQSYPGSYIS